METSHNPPLILLLPTDLRNKKQRRWPIRPDRVLNKWEENFAMHKY